MNIVYTIIIIIITAIYYDFFKKPIDTLYFRNPVRILIGIRNSFIDLLYHKPYYDIYNFKSLHMLHDHFAVIQCDFLRHHHKLKKSYFHDLDAWFDVNHNYYYYNCKDFPYTNALINKIPCIRNAFFSVMDGKCNIPVHKAESNYYLRFQMTIICQNADSWMDLENNRYYHDEGSYILFDHSRQHAVTKESDSRRVVLIADIYRF